MASLSESPRLLRDWHIHILVLGCALFVLSCRSSEIEGNRPTPATAVDTVTPPADAPLPAAIAGAIGEYLLDVHQGNYVGSCTSWQGRTPTVSRPFCDLKWEWIGTTVSVEVGVLGSDFVLRLALESTAADQWRVVSAIRLGGT